MPSSTSAERARAGHELHRRIRLAFDRIGISKQELARRLGVAQATAVEWFSRGRLPDADVVARIPEVLGVNGHWLLTGIGSQAPPGEGPEAADLAIRSGAQAVMADLRRFVGELEERWNDNPTERAKAAAAFVRQQVKRTTPPSGQGRPSRKRAG